jgi:hypothetical protein
MGSNLTHLELFCNLKVCFIDRNPKRILPNFRSFVDTKNPLSFVPYFVQMIFGMVIVIGKLEIAKFRFERSVFLISEPLFNYYILKIRSNYYIYGGTPVKYLIEYLTLESTAKTKL